LQVANKAGEDLAGLMADDHKVMTHKGGNTGDAIVPRTLPLRIDFWAVKAIG
jgi:hypothetical protein